MGFNQPVPSCQFQLDRAFSHGFEQLNHFLMSVAAQNFSI